MNFAALPIMELAIGLPLATVFLAVAAGRFARWLSFIVGPAMLGVAVLLCRAVSDAGTLERAVGGWRAPLGIALGADGLSAAFILTTVLIMGAVGLYARGAEARGSETAHSFAFWPLFYAMWAALNLIFLSRDLFNLYVGLELLTLTAVGMVAFGSVAAALRYLLFALMGSLAWLAGVVLVYASEATLDIILLQDSAPDRAILFAGGLMTAGLMAKTALFPLHAWLPPAHASAPAPASALLSALVVKASFFILARLWFDAMPDIARPVLTEMLGICGAAAVIYGSLLAIRQKRLKLIIAWSTVAQIGYLFFIFPLAGGEALYTPWSAGAWSGGMFHALSHAFAKAALFLAAGLIMEALGHDRIDDIRGIARALPTTIAAFGLAAFSIMGLPPSGGFMAKYLMLTAALADGRILYALVMIGGGLLAAIYLFRPLNVAFAGSDVPEIVPVSRSRQMIPLLLALVATGIGILSATPYEFLQIGRPTAAQEGIG